MAWSRANVSPRKAQLPAGWFKIRQVVLARDDYQCTAIENNMRCDQRATDVDHVDRGGGDDESNLRSLCRHHHMQRTSQQGHDAKPKRTRPTEVHPGIK